MAYKRKRTAGYKPYARPAKRGRVVPGYTRRAGFYKTFGKGGELKFWDTVLGFDIGTLGEIPPTGQLTLVPQGTGEDERIGRKCTIKSIRLRMAVNFTPGVAATASTNLFLYLVLDKQANGAAVVATDVLTATQFWKALPNMSNSRRFTILKQWSWSMNPTAGVTAAYNNHHKYVEYYKKCDLPIEFSGVTGAISEIRSNNLFLLTQTQNASDDSRVDGVCRLRFSDS